MSQFLRRTISRMRDFPRGRPRMPLGRSINSNIDRASFFAGENISVMQGTIVSPDCVIGGNTYIGYHCHLTRVDVGRYASIADGVFIGMGEHSLDEISTNSLFYEHPYEKLTHLPCHIGPDVWIGAGSIIRRGVTIGLGAVIGANSFVNKDVPPYAIVAGSPARIVRYRLPETSIAAAQESRWWELPVDEAGEVLRSLGADRSLKPV